VSEATSEYRPQPGAKPIAPNRFNILSLSGGGFRGLFSAHILSKLEEQKKLPVRSAVDLFAGTSIGGIVAAALAVDVPLTNIFSTIRTEGTKIFGSGRSLSRGVTWLKGWIAAKHPSKPLKDAIERIFAGKEKTKLSDLEVPLLIPAVSYTHAAPYLFKSRGLDAINPSKDSLLDACMATSAAPTFFPAYKLATNMLVDGGLIANAPDTLAITHATRVKGLALQSIRILSVGTAGKPMQRGAQRTISSGILGWLGSHDMVELTLATQEQLAVEEAQRILGQRFLRIDAQPTSDQQQFLALDRADREAIETLVALGEKAYYEAEKQNAVWLGDFLGHKAAWTK